MAGNYQFATGWQAYTPTASASHADHPATNVKLVKQPRKTWKDSGTGTGGTGTGPGLARTASPLRREWACAWPDEEATSDLREARVTIRVGVGVGGRAERVEILGSPPAPFASAARACARGESFQTARDDAGREVAGVTAPFVVHFVR